MSKVVNLGYQPKCTTSPECHAQALLAFPRDTSLVSSKNYNVFTNEVKSRLLRHNFLEESTEKYFICRACVNYSEIYLVDPSNPMDADENISQPKVTKPSVRPEIQIIADEILRGRCTPEELRLLATALGKNISGELAGRASFKIQDERTMQLKTTTYENVWKTEQNYVIKAFIKGIVPYKNRRSQKKKKVKTMIVKAVECIYSAINQNYVSPLGHAENLIMYFHSGSKNACQLFGHSFPSGSYSTVLNTTNALSVEPSKVPPGDVIIAFDNVQFIGRQYRVYYQGRQPISAVTSISVYYEESAINLQGTFQVPTILDRSIGNIEYLKTKLIDFRRRTSETHRNFGNNFIQSRLEKIVLEIERSGDLVAKGEHGQGLDYSRVDQGGHTTCVMDMPCIDVNPNSEKTVREVLDHILELSESSNPNRKWFICVCDGVPYAIGIRIILETFRCTACEVDFMLGDMYNHNLVHHGGQPAPMKRKYEKIILRPGNGHFEINLVRAIFNVYFDVYIEPIAKLLGFNTPKALLYCKSAADHHKSWMILQVLFEALTDEILYLFVKDCQATDSEINAAGLHVWLKGLTNPNYAMASDFIFSVLHPLFLFRAGIRNCNKEVALMAREKASAIFYGNNNPKYREINAYDLFYLLSLPKVGSDSIKSQSIRVTGSTIGQGIDFQVEERNKLILGWVHSDGTPTSNQWRRATTSLNELEKVKARVNENLSLKEAVGGQKKIDLSEEIFQTRKYLRSLKIFDKTKTILVAATRDETPLAQNFTNFIPNCEKNRQLYYDAFLQQKKAKLPLLVPHNFNHLNQKDLKRATKDIIDNLPDGIKHNYMTELRKSNDMSDLQQLYCLAEEELALFDIYQNRQQSESSDFVDANL